MTKKNTTKNAAVLAEITKNNHVKTKKKPVDTFESKVNRGSYKMADYIATECEKLALKGFGSCGLKLDKTTDLFHMDEGRNSCYSSGKVKAILFSKGFKFDYDKYVDHYDAESLVIIWAKNYPHSNNVIGMSWA